jgi:hypothetical protein
MREKMACRVLDLENVTLCQDTDGCMKEGRGRDSGSMEEMTEGDSLIGPCTCVCLRRTIYTSVVLSCQYNRTSQYRTLI